MNGAPLSRSDRSMSSRDAERREDDDVELDEDELDGFIKGAYGPGWDAPCMALLCINQG